MTGTTVGGLGHFTALELARRGARVVLAGRTARSGSRRPRRAILAEVPSASLSVAGRRPLRPRLGTPGGGRGRADSGRSTSWSTTPGVMGTPYRRTADGLELQMATNHFGPFLLTGLLLPQLVASEDATVVTVSSQMHRVAPTRPAGGPAHPARALPALAGLRPDQARQPAVHLRARPPLPAGRRCPVRALAAHPGFAVTHLAANGQYGRAAGGVARRSSTVRSGWSRRTPPSGAPGRR